MPIDISPRKPLKSGIAQNVTKSIITTHDMGTHIVGFEVEKNIAITILSLPSRKARGYAVSELLGHSNGQHASEMRVPTSLKTPGNSIA